MFPFAMIKSALNARLSASVEEFVDIRRRATNVTTITLVFIESLSLGARAPRPQCTRRTPAYCQTKNSSRFALNAGGGARAPRGLGSSCIIAFAALAEHSRTRV